MNDCMKIKGAQIPELFIDTNTLYVLNYKQNIIYWCH